MLDKIDREVILIKEFEDKIREWKRIGSGINPNEVLATLDSLLKGYHKAKEKDLEASLIK